MRKHRFEVWARTALPVSNVFASERPGADQLIALFLRLSHGDMQLCWLLPPSAVQVPEQTLPWEWSHC